MWRPKRGRLDELTPQRVCLIKPSALGDVVQTLPVLAGLRRRWPSARLAWVINHSLAELLDEHPDLDEVIHFPRAARGWNRTSALAQLARRLVAGRFDLVLDLQGLIRSGLMALVAGRGRRVGFAQPREPLARLAYTDLVRLDPPAQPAVVRYWRLAQALGCPGDPPPARVAIDERLAHWVRERLGGLPRPWLVIHPGAAWRTKRWPPEHFAELALRARAEFDASIILVGGPGEQALCQAVARTVGQRVLDLSLATGLRQLAALLQAADLFVSGDTGPMHLAAAMGTPVVAVFTCTSPLLAGPHGAGHRVVATQVACAASYLRTCPTLHCMQELTPARVWPALAAALGAIGGARQAG